MIYRVETKHAVFGVKVDNQGRIERNPEIGWTLTYGTIKELTAAVERQGGRVEEIGTAYNSLFFACYLRRIMR